MNIILKFLLSKILILCVVTLSAQEYRSITGEGNNLENVEWGALHSPLQVWVSNGYVDSTSDFRSADRLNPREISNILFEQEGRIDDTNGLSDYVWALGQFVDHDLTLVEDYNFLLHPEEALFIKPPLNDDVFSPEDLIPMVRSKNIEGTGLSPQNPRRYENAVTSFIDASAVYGSTDKIAKWLRTFKDGKLKVSQGNLLPWNTNTGELDGPTDQSAPEMDRNGLSKYYVTGDRRANENPALIALHTLFVREHNSICDELKAENPSWDDEELYLMARKIVAAELQSIIYNEWLPTLGIDLGAYRGYRSDMNPGISNVFSAAAFRLGHTLINSNLIRMRNDGTSIPRGNISLKDAFFNPLSIELAGGIDPYLQGMAAQVQQDFDCKMIDDLRNFLFSSSGKGGLDLAAININRGRERGLPNFNKMRVDLGLPRLQSVEELTDNEDLVMSLKEIYGDVNNIDPWVGMLCERRGDGASFGITLKTILVRQFRALREGDRFYFENDTSFSDERKLRIKNTSLSDLIIKNTSVNSIQDNVFLASNFDEIPSKPIVRASDMEVVIYPNIIQQEAKCLIYCEAPTVVDLQVFNMSGQLIKELRMNMNQGVNKMTMLLDPHLPSGFYNVRFSSEYKYTIKRILKN